MDVVVCIMARNALLRLMILAFCLAPLSDATAGLGRRWSINLGAGVRQPTFNRNSQPWVISPTFEARFYYKATERLSIGPLFSYSKVYNDSMSIETFKIGRENANEVWKNYGIGLAGKIYVYPEGSFMPYVKLGVGLSIWDISSIATGQPVSVTNSGGSDTDYEATELFILGGIGAESFIHPRWSINYNIELFYLTGIGADFDDATEDYRSRGYANFKVGLAFYFGKRDRTLWEEWRDSGEMAVVRKQPPRFIERELYGGSPYDHLRQSADDFYADSDYDGVRNDIDLCPDTPIEAKGFVDETGCPTDVDSDGVPDYMDDCFDTPLNMTVDTAGCPLDQDSDGVPDDIDKCPNTPRGFQVDNDGCFDKFLIFSKRILHASYQPGGSGIDMKTGLFLDSLTDWLRAYPGVTVKILGYTDNIGNAEANLKLSRKRADKIKNYLVVNGVGRDRIEAVGKGMTGFLASNQTRAGREKNRRIEIEFIY
jgi:outer membrane protein OmpA-like peptidoglycan-associated protein